MSPPDRSGDRCAAMERLGSYSVMPKFGLMFSSALRNCTSCIAREACFRWSAKRSGTPAVPPEFCRNRDLLSELLCDAAIGHRSSALDMRPSAP